MCLFHWSSFLSTIISNMWSVIYNSFSDFLNQRISSPAADMVSFNWSHCSVDPGTGSAKAENLFLRNIWKWTCIMKFFTLLVSYHLDFTSFFSCLLSFIMVFAIAKCWSLHTSAQWSTCMSCRQGILHLIPIPILSICV